MCIRDRQVRVQVPGALGQGEDRVRHELARAVVGGLAAALDRRDRERHAPGVPLRRASAARDHGVVLDQQQLVADLPADPRLEEVLLQRVGLLEVPAPEVPHLERRAASLERSGPSGAIVARRHFFLGFW